MGLMEKLALRRSQSRTDKLRERRVETTTTVIPMGGGADPEDPEKKPEPGMEDGAGEGLCPECGKSSDECTCNPRYEANDETKTDPDDDESGSSSGMTTGRSGDNDMGANDKSAPSITSAATLAQLRADELFGGDTAFCVECVEAGRTMTQAQHAWGKKQAAVIAEQQKQLAGIARLGGEGIGGTTPVAAMPGGGGGGGGGGGVGGGKLGLGMDLKPKVAAVNFATYEDAVEYYQSERGGKMSQYKANREAAIRFPALHQYFLARGQAIRAAQESATRV